MLLERCDVLKSCDMQGCSRAYTDQGQWRIDMGSLRQSSGGRTCSKILLTCKIWQAIGSCMTSIWAVSRV